MGEVIKLPTAYQRRPKPLLDSPIFNFTDGWDVPTVKSALAAMEQGQFMAAAQLADAMDRDDRIAAVLDTRIRALLGCEQQWGPDEDPDADEEDETQPDAGTDDADDADDADPDDAALAESIEAFKDAFPQLLPDPALSDLLRWGIRLGVGLGELVWFDKTGRYQPTPRLKIWHPQFLYWRWDTRSYWVTTQNTGIVEVTAGDGRWVLFTPFGEQRGWMQGAVRKLSLPYLIRQYAMRDSARYSEAYGLPVKQGIVPTNADAPDKERFLIELSQLANEATILTPQLEDGQTKAFFDFKIHELVGKGHDVFETQLRLSDTNIAVVVLGQNMTTEAGTEGGKGALATATVHDKVRGDVLEFDAKSLAACLSEQALRPWSVANRGDEEVPDWQWQTDPPEDETAKSLTVKTVSDAMAQFKTAGAPVNQRKLLEEYSIPLLTEDEEQAQKDEQDAKDEADRQVQVDTAAAVAKAKGAGAPPGALSREVDTLRAQVAELRQRSESSAHMTTILEGFAKIAESLKPAPPAPPQPRPARTITFTKDENGVVIGAKLSGE